MKKFNIDDYEENTVMSFANKEEYDAFCKYLDKLGKKWSSGTKYTTEIHNSAFIPYDERGLYFLKGTYSDLDRIKDDDKLLKYSDFDWSEEGLSTLTKEEYMREMTEKEKKAELFGKQSLLPTPEEWAELHQMYVATDRNGEVWMYATKPRKLSVSWVNDILGGFNITSLVQPQTGECWENSLYIPTSLRPKYRAYTEPKIEWLGKEIRRKGLYIAKIEFVGEESIITKDGDQIWYDDLLQNYIWPNGTPCGDPIE